MTQTIPADRSTLAPAPTSSVPMSIGALPHQAHMRILIVGLNYTPEPVGIGPYTAGLARGLAERGHSLRVIAAQPYYPQWRRSREFRAWGTRREGDVEVTRCPHYVPRRPSGLRRVLHLASFAAAAFVPAIIAALKDRPHVVMVVAPALLSVPVAWLAARLAKARLWIHIQDLEIEAAFATGLLRPGGSVARFARRMESRLLGSGDVVSTIGPKMAERLISKGIRSQRIRQVRNWAADDFAPNEEEAARYRTEWHLGERHVALYSGNIANKQGIEIVIEAARRLARRDDLIFVICGEGPNRDLLAKLAAGLPNVQLHDLQPAERMGGLLALASVHLLPQIPGAADLVLPSKLTNMLASGRPVVATAAPDSGLSAEVEGCGIVTPPEDAEAFAGAITALLDAPDLRRLLGDAAKARASERWSRETILDGWARELTLLSRERA